MKIQTKLFICIIAFWTVMLCPLQAKAQTPLDPASDASLTLHYQKDGQAFSNLEIQIFRVAEAFPDGTFALAEPYKSYPISIYDITVQEQWMSVAATLECYIVADGLSPTRTEKTDDFGTVEFDRLETGLYFISEAIADNDSGTYVFNQFMAYLPTPCSDGTYNYRVEAKPKCISVVPKSQYRVTKLWQDGVKQSDRPKKITVDIFKDGSLWETKILSAENNWSYVWYASDDVLSNWTVAERNVSEQYTVSVHPNGTTFTIINSHKSTHEIPEGPETGDTANPILWIFATCISGILLVLLGIYNKRRKGE